MNRFLVVVALIGMAACDAPWSGPTLPDGAHEISLRQLSVQGGPFDLAPDIAASTSLSDVRQQVIAHAIRARFDEQHVCLPAATGLCWGQFSQEQGVVYVAVITNYECTSAVKERTAVGGQTLYFIHWVGNPQGVCNASMAVPSWRLYSASRHDLPGTGTLKVRFELQGTEHGAIDTQVALS